MRTSNPVFNKRREFATFGSPGQYQQPNQGQYGQQHPYQQPQFRQQQYGQQAPYQQPQFGQQSQPSGPYGPPAGPQPGFGRGGEAMTYDHVVVRTALLFAVMLVAAVPGWMALSFVTAGMLLALWLGSFAVLVGLGLFIQMGRTIRPSLMFVYAAVQGLAIGLISSFFESRDQGIVVQAVLATVGAFAAMLIAYKVKAIRATPKLRRFLVIAGFGYFIFILLNLASSLFFNFSFFWSTGPIGIGLSILGVGLASLFLILDFDNIDTAVRNRAPEQVAWLCAFGLMVTLVWLYYEMLRLIAILRN